jgi:hypothetical protein
VTSRLNREHGAVPLLAAILRDSVKLTGALCTHRHQLFDAEAGDQADREYAADRAKKMCRRCPVLTDCRDWINSLPPSQRPAGVVAGQITNHHERKAA